MDKETMEIYKKKRHEVMTEEEIKEADKFLDWYRSSWRDKEQRGLFDKWEQLDLYWEGDINEPESDADPGSNTNIIHPNVEGQVALMCEQNIAIQTKPVGPSDAPYSEIARILLEWVKEKNKLVRKLDVHERRREKFGTGIFRVLFDPDFMDGFGLPKIEPCNPAYVFTDPNVTDIYKVQEGQFIIETANKSLFWAKQNFDEERVNAIVPGYDTIEGDVDVFGEKDGENDDLSKDNYMHMYIWCRYKDGEESKLRLVQMSGDGIILKDSKKDDEEGFYPTDRYPYFFTPLYFREGTVWGKGDAELLTKQNDMVNEFDDQTRINARLTGNIQKVVSTASGIDLDKWTNEPGLNVPANGDLDNAYKIVQPGQMPAYIINRRDRVVDVDAQKVTRFSDQMAGIRQKGVDTATEALSLQQSGTIAIDHKKLLLQETLSEVFEYALLMIKEYWTEEQAFRITEKENEFIFFKGSKLKEIPLLMPATQQYRAQWMNERKINGIIPEGITAPEYMQNGEEIKEAMFDISVTVGAGLPNNKAFVYQMVKEARADNTITPEEYREWLIKNMGLPFSPKPPMPAQPVPMPQGNLSPDVMGLNQGGNPAALGGVPGV